MSTITIRLSDKLLHEIDLGAKAIHAKRTEYIRKAIEYMNKEVFAEQRKKKLQKASLKARKESMRVNAEFSEIEDDSKI